MSEPNLAISGNDGSRRAGLAWPNEERHVSKPKKLLRMSQFHRR